jgi:hypothetical protein
MKPLVFIPQLKSPSVGINSAISCNDKQQPDSRVSNDRYRGIGYRSNAIYNEYVSIQEQLTIVSAVMG